MLRMLGHEITNDMLRNELKETYRKLRAPVHAERTACAQVAAAVQQRTAARADLVGVANRLSKFCQ